MTDRDLIELIKDCAREVFNELGSSHSEAVYESALAAEINLRDRLGAIPILRQIPCPIRYKGLTVGMGYIDLMIPDQLLIELKTVNKLTSRDEGQLYKYLTGTPLPIGLLINFSQESEEVDIHEVHYDFVPLLSTSSEGAQKEVVDDEF